MSTKKYTAPALLAITGLLLAGCAPSVEEQQSGSTETETDNNNSSETTETEELKDPVQVAVITTLSGAFAPYGEAYEAGLLPVLTMPPTERWLSMVTQLR